MFDLVIRGGTVVDGTGALRRPNTDVAVNDGRISAIGSDLGLGRREIDARGKVVTPGFVDVHTHYDGQATWDPIMAPSSWHGVTTVIIGNCGVGFAPVISSRRRWLIDMMEGVEDIPGDVLAAGIRWDWETFPEYLDALEKMDRTVDVATQIAHGPLRAYVMGERGAYNEVATPADIQAMADLVEEAVRAGALGFTTSRTRVHKGLDGECVPGTFASEEELKELGRAMARGGYGVFEVASDYGMGGRDGEFASDVSWMPELSVETGMPVFYLLQQVDRAPTQWREVLDELAEVNRSSGAKLVAMTAARPPGVLMGLEGSAHPFKKHPTFVALEHLPLSELVAELRRPDVKARILDEETGYDTSIGFFNDLAHGFHTLFPLGDPPDYEPSDEDCILERAKRAGRDPYEFCYDLLLEDEGQALLYMAVAEYSDKTLDVLLDRLRRDDCVVSLSDAGAHARSICDASMPTFMLSYWVRDRVKGAKLSLEEAVKLQAHDTAELYGLLDRGVLAPGYRADINVIDFDRLTLHAPRMEYDLPTGAGRFLQPVDGYVATVVNGEITFEDGKHTGALPGRLVRGAQLAPPDDHPSIVSENR